MPGWTMINLHSRLEECTYVSQAIASFMGSNNITSLEDTCKNVLINTSKNPL